MTIIEAFIAVWEVLIGFLVDLFPQVTALFYTAETGLTFVGVMAVIMAGIALVLLVWNIIRSFFPMRG